MQEEDLKKIFEPFFSTKGSKGNGLGLPVVLGIVEPRGILVSNPVDFFEKPVTDPMGVGVA